MRVFQINTTYDIGSTGRIVAGIDRVLINADIDSYSAFGYGNIQDDHHYKIINKYDSYCHNVLSRISDGQGLYSCYKTQKLLEYIDKVDPDIVHLHNLHGNYLNYKILFLYLKNKECKIVWTLHDCWSFTGHCAYFDMVGCKKWKSACVNCPQIKSYPPAIFDRSERNYRLKKELFTSLRDRLIMVPVSDWLHGLLEESFFNNINIQTIHNGINLENFKPYLISSEQKYILGVAASWDKRKGFYDFLKLRTLLDWDIKIILVGLSKKQISILPEGIIGLECTNSIQELTKLYSGAIAFVNTTYEDNYPTVNLEAIACGTPVITYRTGGSPESVNYTCGIVVNQGDIEGLEKAIRQVSDRCQYSHQKILEHARKYFNELNCFKSYLDLYKML